MLSPSLFKPSTRECEQELSFKKRLPCKSETGKFEAGGAAIACDGYTNAYTFTSGNPPYQNDAMFSKYELGTFADEEMRPTDTTYRTYWKGLQHNPMLDFLRPIIEVGVSFFACNNSLSGFAYELALKFGEPTRAA